MHVVFLASIAGFMRVSLMGDVACSPTCLGQEFSQHGHCRFDTPHAHSHLSQNAVAGSQQWRSCAPARRALPMCQSHHHDDGLLCERGSRRSVVWAVSLSFCQSFPRRSRLFMAATSSKWLAHVEVTSNVHSFSVDLQLPNRAWLLKRLRAGAQRKRDSTQPERRAAQAR